MTHLPSIAALIVFICSFGSSANASTCVLGSVLYSEALCGPIEAVIKGTPKLKIAVSVSPIDGNAWSCPHIKYLSQARLGLFKNPKGRITPATLGAEISRESEIPLRILSEENFALSVRVWTPPGLQPDKAYLVYLAQGGRFYEVQKSLKNGEPVTVSVLARISDLCLQDESYLFIAENSSSFFSMMQYERPEIVAWTSFSRLEIASLIEQRRTFYRDRYSDLSQ